MLLLLSRWNKKVKRFALLIFFGVISVSYSFAVGDAEIWFAPYPAGFNVNLSDTALYNGYTEGESLGNQEDKLIAVVGFGGMTIGDAITYLRSVSIDFKFTSQGNNDWNYVSASEPFLKRPFGIDVVVSYEDFDEVLESGKSNTGETIEKFGFFNDKSTSGDISDNISLNIDKIKENKAVWVGFFLNLPEEDGNINLDTALSADDYYCNMQVNLTIKEGLIFVDTHTQSWNYTFNGYVGDEPDNSKTHVFFNVMPNANANSIQISALEDGGQVDIGAYSYETQAFLYNYTGNSSEGSLDYQGQKNNSYYVFVSSSADPTLDNSNNYFQLVNAGIESNPSESNVIKYEIGIKSTYPNRSSGVKWFDGTASMNSDTKGMLAGNKREEQIGHSNIWETHKSIVFEDEGEIYIRASQKEYEKGFSASDFRAGIYTSKVYFHVVSNC